MLSQLVKFSFYLFSLFLKIFRWEKEDYRWTKLRNEAEAIQNT